MLKMLREKKAFTLIELLIVVVILGILIALVIAATTGNRARSNDERRRADMARIQESLEGCFADTGAYPANLQDDCVEDSFGGNPAPNDPNGGAYPYVQNSNTTYTLTAQMERIRSQENIDANGLMTLNEKQ